MRYNGNMNAGRRAMGPTRLLAWLSEIDDLSPDQRNCKRFGCWLVSRSLEAVIGLLEEADRDARESCPAIVRRAGPVIRGRSKRVEAVFLPIICGKTFKRPDWDAVSSARTQGLLDGICWVR